MTHVITSLCLRDNSCSDVCPVSCINPGIPQEQWPGYYIDPTTCIDCGACIPECPYSAIFPEEEVSSAYQAKGGEWFNRSGLKGRYQGTNHRGQAIILETARTLASGEVVDLSESIQFNCEFYQQ